MTGNNHDESYDLNLNVSENTGYGDTAPQSPAGPNLSFGSFYDPHPQDPPNSYGWTYAFGSQSQAISHGMFGVASTAGGTFGSSHYPGFSANPDSPPGHAVPQESARIPAPSDLSSRFNSNERLCHDHIAEGPSNRPELSPFDSRPPSGTVADALQDFPPINQPRPLDAHVTPKVMETELARFTSLLKSQPWLVNHETEPPIVETDAFVVCGYVDKDATSRFFWLIRQDSDGRFHCRIPHSWSSGKKKGRPCDHHVLKLKDAIAHISEYYKYAPYQCLGNGQHGKCPRRFYTPERRNDHYSKMRSSRVEKVGCPHCAIEPMDKRNLDRHVKKKHPGLPVQPA